MKYYRRALYDRFINFYNIISDDYSDTEAQLRGKMGHLVRKARKALPDDMPEEVRIHKLLELFYGEWGFHCDAEDYFYSRNLYLPYVFESHKGMPVTLGAMVLYLADALDLPLYPVNFPTQLLLRAEVRGSLAFIDPWDGSYMTAEKIKQLYEGAFGFGVQIQPEELDRAELPQLYSRFEQLAINALIREEHNDLAFRYIEYLLITNKDNPYYIRDRGLVLAQMGAYPAALKDLEFFVDHCPQDPTAALIRTQLLELKGEIDKSLYPVH